VVDLELPDQLGVEQRELIDDLAERNDADHVEGMLGLVLSGSAARGMATVRSDLDVYVVLFDDSVRGRRTTRSTPVDEIPVSLSKLEAVPPFGSQGWWFRWSFAWAPTLLDRTDGRIPAAVRRQATLTPEESDAVLVDHDRLDGWINYPWGNRTTSNARAWDTYEGGGCWTLSAGSRDGNSHPGTATGSHALRPRGVAEAVTRLSQSLGARR